MNNALANQISWIMGKPSAIALSREFVQQRTDLKELIDITFHADRVIGFRTAWVLEHICLDDPIVFLPYIAYFISRIKEVTNPGCKRHYAKIIMHLTDRKATPIIRQYMNGLELEPVVEQLFDWMIDPKVLVAVKVFAGEALFNLRSRYPWIAGELAEQLEFLMRDGSMAIRTRGRHLLKELKSGK